MKNAPSNGFVTLVGAGCGPGLITVRGLEALRQADVILYDDLLDRGLLNDPALASAEILFVGKRSGAHSVPQEETTALLIAKAKEGKRVVRLKGGDSFVFGRGAEELLALQEAGIPFELVPGVTSAVAVPEDFGIPVTHRGVSRSFTVVTGHTAADPNAAEENYEALAGLQGTLVFLMGLHNLDTICGELIKHGKAPDTPASVLSKGFLPGAARYDGTLQTIAAVANDAQTPAILVVGDVASFRLEQSHPEAGPSVSVIGTDTFCARFLKKCPSAVPFPLVDIRPADGGTLPDLNGYEWLVFLSANAIRFFFEQVSDVRSLAALKLACVGPSTAAALKDRGFVADFVPSRYDRETLMAELPGDGPVLLLGAADTAGARGPGDPRFRVLGLYEAATRKGPADIRTDYVVFASASGVRAFFENGGRLNDAVPVCIGKPTAKELSNFDITGRIAPAATIDSILEEVRRLETARDGQTGEPS
ncbi:MAG: uroporphyrinogen-III C-methyltransferase [Clostridia bacterium]|nr:uroporphyrinogen-III C-methyltransferase [Clostridia bacterium]